MGKTVFIKNQKLPTFLPHGWKTTVAGILTVHPNTIRNNIKIGKGPVYDKIVETARRMYGEGDVES